jgi:hypothetical protein
MNTTYLRQETRKLIDSISSTAVFESIEKHGATNIHYKGKLFVIFQLSDGSLAENIYEELPNGGLRCISD